MKSEGRRREWSACALSASVLVAGCRPAPASSPEPAGAGERPVVVPDVPLAGVAGGPDETIGTRQLAARSPITVLVFFSPDCHCLSVHEPRLRALSETDGPQGVQFVMIDSEVRGSPERDAEEARRRGYRFPILLDRGGRLARALGAEYAGYAVVVDSRARVHYRGGIDSDRTHLHDGRARYLEQALDDLLDHREPRLAEGKTLGCVLETW